VIGVIDFAAVVAAVTAHGFGDDISWAESIEPPATAEAFASEAIFVICNSRAPRDGDRRERRRDPPAAQVRPLRPPVDHLRARRDAPAVDREAALASLAALEATITGRG
jgi:hypothetical protein